VQTLLNLEMAATQDMVKVAYEFKPDMVTLVPERREEVTTEGGLDVNSQRDAVAKVVKNLKDGDIIVSLFIDPDLDQVKASHRVSADRVELHTGRYCEARTDKDRQREFGRIVDAAKACGKLGMGCAAGHGLNYDNVRPIAKIAEIDELNIGHAIVARAVMVGFDRAVREMIELLRNP
jgi:pyridoxine 5-phosphate synthase